MDRGIGSWVTKRALLDGDRVAFVEASRDVTYDQFDQRTDRLARALLQLGVRRGDRVAMLLANSVTFMETLLACAKLGAIAVPVNYRLAAPEVAYILVDSGADVLVYHGAFAATARTALDDPETRVRHRVVDRGPLPVPADFAIADDELAYPDVVASGPLRPVEMDIDLRDVQGIMYTSGTTGRPKGAMLTHANAIANARNNVAYGRGLRMTDVTVTAAPMFHIGGLGVHTLPLLYVGGTTVVQPTFDPDQVLDAMSSYRATVQFLVPAMWAAVMRVRDFDTFDLSSLELCLSGGAPTPLPVLEFFSDRGLPFQEGFGMTETSPSVSVLDADHVKARAGSIGRPLPAVEAKLVDETDREVPAGTVGELVLQGDNIFAGYWMLPEATAEASRGGWFHTGDLGRADDEGFITLVDRKKDMIISGGENVYPIEVEQILFRHPAVREAAVFGVPDDRWGETVVAAVAFDADPVEPGELVEFCRDRLAHFKCPTHVEVVDELPRNATGKVLKTALRQTFGGRSTAVSR